MQNWDSYQSICEGPQVSFYWITLFFSTGPLLDMFSHVHEAYITGNLPGGPGSLERDGVQPEVTATSTDLFPGVSVDFLDQENKGQNEQRQ